MEFYGSTQSVDNRNTVYAASDPGFKRRHADSALPPSGRFGSFQREQERSFGHDALTWQIVSARTMQHRHVRMSTSLLQLMTRE